MRSARGAEVRVDRKQTEGTHENGQQEQSVELVMMMRIQLSSWLFMVYGCGAHMPGVNN